MATPRLNPNNNSGNLQSTLRGLDQVASDSIAITQKSGQLNNLTTGAEMLEKMAKKGYDAAKGLIG